MKKKNTRLISIQPATRWEDAFPIGNGNIAALIYGNICEDTIIINHEELWFPVEKIQIPDISKSLKELREILDEEEWFFTENFLNIMFAEKGCNLNQSKSSFHPACELKIKTEAHIPFSHYYRTLNLENALYTTSWYENDEFFEREHFVSRTNNLICLRISGDRPRSYEIKLQPRDPTEENRAFKSKNNVQLKNLPLKFKTFKKNNILVLIGTYDTEKRYATLVKYITPSKSIKIDKNMICGNEIKEMELYIKIIPNLFEETDLDEQIQLFSAEKHDYSDIKNKSIKIHKNLFNRLSLNIAPSSDDHNDEFSEDEMATSNKENIIDYQLLDSYNGNVSQDLVEKLFYYGRYLLICSSPENGWPANLQGKWNGNYYPAWSSDYHNDENIQMNYWAALPGNLPEMTKSYFEYYNACIADCRENAKKLFGCGGILLPIAQTIKGEAPLYGGPWLNWTAAAGWIAQLYYDYYLFTNDEKFLKKQTIPYLKEVAAFYEDFLYKDESGKYVFSPSISPENVPDIPGGSLITKNATMDIMVTKEVLNNLCEGCTRLGIESKSVLKWRKMINDLPEYEVNEDGAIKEWIHPNLKDNYKHRHLSHIYGLFPGFEITQTHTPQIFNACRIAVKKRQVVGQMSQSGWSLAHMANIYARISDGEKALQCIENLIRSNVGPNLFTYHNDWRNQGLTLHWDFMDRIFQIDSNFGITAAILEMLAFSNQKLIKILPALPNKWNKGAVKGILLRGGIELEMKWNIVKNHLTMKFKANNDIIKQLEFPWKVSIINMQDITDKIQKSEFEPKLFEIRLEKGEILDLIVSMHE